ncbi:MAG: indolepyruvate ferredoxin oxidoreductase family protein [Ideonella sp.]|nr:indolepyruvate ferredoxin oxidoreductase family protein [Ideonella sp.]
MTQPADVALDDKYRLESGRVFVTGVQALSRLPMLQRERDRAAGLNTAGYVSGYRGSPLGGLDTALHEAEPFLAAHDVRFQPGVNEDLAATAIWGTQQLHLLPGAKKDGIFSMWYGKGPGVDRCGDVFKHANNAGTSRHGGVLVVAGDDHAARSSAVAHQSEHIFSACGIPVLAPASVQDILDYGLHGWAMSRYTGCWVALKLSADVVESSATVEIASDRVQVEIPSDFALPADGMHIRWPDPQLAQEQRMQAYKIYAAVAYARVNRLDRLVWDSPDARLGLIACGKAWLDLRQALHELGIDDEAQAARLGLRVYKVGMPWPLEATGARRFATGLTEILVVEEKRQIIEYQLKEMLYDWRDDVRPRVLGKFDETGEWPAPPHQWLLPPTGEMTPAIVARALASRLARIDPDGPWAERAQAIAGRVLPPAPLQRTPYFCSGCPHNRSTRVPEGSCAFGGVGCHLMAVGMERNTLTISQMGGEGAGWIGMAEHAGTQHMFANMGDGTYFHSGLLAIRAAIAARVNITYKLLYNDAVAMTGGQPVDGPLTVPQLTRQIAAEGVERIVVLADDTHKYRDQPPRRLRRRPPTGESPAWGGPARAASGFAPGVRILPRTELDAVQRELREVKGVTILVYDQTCATEARRRRKRGLMPAPDRQVFINDAVCEGCGDCSVKSNCLSVVPLVTEFGTKRAIDPFSCNLDLSCLEGCCPALVTVEGAKLKRSQGLPLPGEALPEPALPALDGAFSLLVAGVGGTGVVTVGALLGMAAHLEGKAATVLDQTGMSQKGGAVLTHVRIAASDAALHSPRIVSADLLLGCDLLVAASPEALLRVRAGRTRAVLNTAEAITGELVRHPEMRFPRNATLALLHEALGGPADELDATHLAATLAGNSIATNIFLLGFAWQRGWVPVGREALMRAIELNGVAAAGNAHAFGWGRRAAADLQRTLARAAAAQATPPSQRLSATLDEFIARRRAALVAFGGESIAQRYAALVDRVRAAEQRVAPGSERLARAVAQQAHRLLAFKDEYEVARLFSDPAFDAALASTFDGDLRVHFHLALPWQRGDGAGGEIRKRHFGPWMRGAMRLLAQGRHLRGTLLDPLAWTAERRLARALAADYEDSVERLLKGLSAVRLGAAVEIAEWPADVRGFGPVKQRAANAAQARRAQLLAAWDGARKLPELAPHAA